jgi:hypothetical protein
MSNLFPKKEDPQESHRVEILSPEVEKALSKIVEKTYFEIQKRDYRATVVHREEKGEVPSDVATFMHVDETTQDAVGNPTELDVKGTINEFEKYLFSNITFAQAFERLKDWWCFEEIQDDPNDKEKKILVQTPVNLAQMDMLAQKRLDFSLKGTQSDKHIAALRASSGRGDDTMLQKTANWLGWRKESKQAVQQNYGQTQQR